MTDDAHRRRAAFREFAGIFHQDFELVHNSLDEVICWFAAEGTRLRELKAYLSEQLVLDAEGTVALVTEWSRHCAGVVFRNAFLRRLYVYVVEFDASRCRQVMDDMLPRREPGREWWPESLRR